MIQLLYYAGFLVAGLTITFLGIEAIIEIINWMML